MSKRPVLPIALTVGGSDSGGGAGIQADLKTFAALGVHGVCAITAVTAQNPRRVLGMEAVSLVTFRRQLEGVFEEMRPAAAKTGMLCTADIVRETARFFKKWPGIPLVVDPIMVATSGRRLLEPGGIKVLIERLLPLATLVTPNLAETGVLTGRVPRSLEEMREAAREIFRRFGSAVLVKGGHLTGVKESADILYDGRNEWLLTVRKVAGIKTHGTGCTLSAAITAYLVRGQPLEEAVIRAKDYVTWAIAESRTAAGHSILGHFSI